jgi:hypothetical protein
VLVAAGPSSDMVEARSGFFKTGLDAVLGLSETGTSRAVTPSDGERYRDTRQQSNACSTELLDQSSPAFAASR